MIKLIPTQDLKVGMYIHDLNCDWMAHPFAWSKFKVGEDSEITKIASAGIREIYIDTARGLDAAHAPTTEEVGQQIQNDLVALAAEPCAPQQVGHGEEIERARNIKHQAEQAVIQAMRDVRLGKALLIDSVEPVVSSVTSSILRNSGALISLVGIKDKDLYTFQHSVAVCTLMVAFCRHEGMDDEAVHQAGLGGLLHDIGKTRMSNALLNKPGRYTNEEFAVMRRHPEDGHAILSATDAIGPTPLAIALQHHERMDGSGYPFNLGGAQIERVAQMAAIVDVYDAITADRCYHLAIPPADGLRKLMEWSKYHLSPYYTQSFVRCIGIYPVGTLVRLESQRLAIVTEHNAKDLLKPKVKVIFDAKRNQYIAPKEIDLARSMGHGGADTIVGHESARKWFIDLSYFQ